MAFHPPKGHLHKRNKTKEKNIVLEEEVRDTEAMFPTQSSNPEYHPTWGGGRLKKAATNGNTLWLCNLLNWGAHKEEGWWRTDIYFIKETWIPLE